MQNKRVNVNRGIESTVKVIKGTFLRVKSSLGPSIRYFFSHFKCGSGKNGSSKYWFTGNLIIAKNVTGGVIKGDLVISDERCLIEGIENICLVPYKTIKALKNFSGFYENLKIRVWEGKSERGYYKDKVLYGSDCFDYEEITNIRIYLPVFTVFISAPAEPLLEKLELEVSRFVNRVKRFRNFRRALPAEIDQVLAKELGEYWMRLVFKNCNNQRSGFQDYSSKFFMIERAFDLFLKIKRFMETEVEKIFI